MSSSGKPEIPGIHAHVLKVLKPDMAIVVVLSAAFHSVSLIRRMPDWTEQRILYSLSGMK